ncbi:hypothetical protein S7335_5421 [Synechococcus sp. PCC 7335]|nr:hypothetical protein S7335_5421 [Synechococcus sp. PCC 7335]
MPNDRLKKREGRKAGQHFRLGLKLRMRLDPEKDFATFCHVEQNKCCFDHNVASVA